MTSATRSSGWLLALGALALLVLGAACSSQTSENTTGIFTLEVGACLPFGVEFGPRIELTPCSEPHGYEVVVVDTLWDPGDTFPGQPEVEELVVEFCKVLLDELDPDFLFDLAYLYPTAETWAADDRRAVCMAEALEPTRTTLLPSTTVQP